MKIVIDPGHYGFDSGAVGPSNTYERDITMLVSLKIEEILKNKGVEVKLTRSLGQTKIVSNLNEDLMTRVKFANDWQADYFVSIHCNAFTDPAANGMEIYTTPEVGESDRLAESVAYSMIEFFPDLKFRADLSDGDKDKEANFYVIRKTTMPAILIELAFISNPAEEKILNSKEGQEKFAKAVSAGILRYLGLDFSDLKNVADQIINTSFENDIRILQQAGVVNSPDYWLQTAFVGKVVSGENVSALIKNMAAYINKKRGE